MYSSLFSLKYWILNRRFVDWLEVHFHKIAEDYTKYNVNEKRGELSVRFAVWIDVLIGSFGLLYSTVEKAILMLLLNVSIFTFSFSLVIILLLNKVEVNVLEYIGVVLIVLIICRVVSIYFTVKAVNEHNDYLVYLESPQHKRLKSLIKIRIVETNEPKITYSEWKKNKEEKIVKKS